MATAFNMKAVPKAATETDFKNFLPYSLNRDFMTRFVGKVVYVNAVHPGKHIYSPYYTDGKTAHRMSYETKDNKITVPVFTLQDLAPEDIIIHYTQEEWDQYLSIKKP